MDPDQERSKLSFQHNPAELENILESEEFLDIADSLAEKHSQMPLTTDVEAGVTIDGYKLIELLGAGGMGEVWKAEESGPEKLLVALKVILLGMNSVEVCARFNAERKALAIMDHPSIAKVYGGGSTSKGRPYFVMELVEGERITTYATKANLAIEARLALIVRACEALQHAHLKGIVHRDLKPSNLLVSDNGGEPVIKVIDFGIAKALHGSTVDHNTTITREGQVIGTLAYMSPEQTIQDTTQVDARSDVYSLGAILYELLTGTLPIDVSDMSKGRDQAMQLIRNVVPKKPSAHKGLARGLFGKELDWVLMKTLEKEPSRRYQSAFAFGDDIQRLLDRQPVAARPPSVPYVLSKWVSRHRRIVTACLAFAVIGSIVAAIIRTQVLEEIARNDDRTWVKRLREASTIDALRVVEERDILSAYVSDLLGEEREKYPLDTRSGMQARLAMLTHAGTHSLLAESLWATLEDDAQPSQTRLHAAALLAIHTPEDDRWSRLSGDIAGWLTEEALVTSWIDYFEPIREHLRPTLEKELFHRPPVRKNAAILLAAYARDDLDGLVALTALAEADQISPLVAALKTHGQTAVNRLSRFLGRDLRSVESEHERDERALEQARAGMALMRLGHSDKVTPHLLHPPTDGDPRLQSFLIHSFGDYGVDQSTIISFLKSEQPWMVRAGLIALGDYSVSERRKASLVNIVIQLFINHPDPGVHACAEWLLRHWHHQDESTASDAAPDLPMLDRRRDPLQKKRWFVNRSGMTMVVVPGPSVFMMGVPESEPDREIRTEARERVIPHVRIIPRSFAIASKELTFGQYEPFEAGFLERAQSLQEDVYEANSRHITKDKALAGVSINDALRYCNRLSEIEGIPPDQWCFVEPANPKEDVQFKTNYLSLTGYRLATEAEWEYACRSGSVTARPYGQTESLLSNYAWFVENSGMRAWPPGQLRPNALGLFDILGNRAEWVLGYRVPHPAPLYGVVVDTETAVGLSPLPSRRAPHYSKRGGYSESRPKGLRSGVRGYSTGNGWATTIRITRTINPRPIQKR